jgi:hypothetical protein
MATKEGTDSTAGGAAAADSLIENVRRWAEPRADVRALVLVGSRARGIALPDSDIDLVLVCADPLLYRNDRDWLSAFGEPTNISLEDWGQVQSLRVSYADGAEVEFGITSVEWTAVPVDPGTAEVLRSGNAVLLDRDGRVGAMLRAFQTSA